MDAMRQEGTLQPSPPPEVAPRPLAPLPAGRDVLVDVRRWMEDLSVRTLAIVDRDEHDARDVHQTRLTMKRLRALWQMLRPVTPSLRVRSECRQVAGAARVLAADRDAFVLRETLVGLREEATKEKQRQAIGTVLEHLPEPRATCASPIRAYAEFLRQRVHLSLDSSHAALNAATDAGVLIEGTRRTYARAQKLGLKAYFKNTSRPFHRWRKWVKYLYYQLEILQPDSKDLKEMSGTLDQLGKILGSSHDLANLRALLAAGSLPITDERAARRVSKLALRRERELNEGTRELAARAFSEAPETFARRLRHACS